MSWRDDDDDDDNGCEIDFDKQIEIEKEMEEQNRQDMLRLQDNLSHINLRIPPPGGNKDSRVVAVRNNHHLRDLMDGESRNDESGHDDGRFRILQKQVLPGMSPIEVKNFIDELVNVWCPQGCSRKELFSYWDNLFGPDFSENALMRKQKEIVKQYSRLKREVITRQLEFLQDISLGLSESDRKGTLNEMNANLHLIASAVFDAKDMVIRQERMRLRQDPRTRAQLPRDETLYSYYQPMEIVNMKDNHRFIAFLLNRCSEMTLCKRRDDEVMYKPKYSNGCFTYSYEPYMPFEQFVYHSVTPKEMYPEQWCWLQGKGYNSATSAAKFLMNTYDHQIPFIQKDRHYHSWLNGVYYLPDDTFFSYENEADQRALTEALGSDIDRKCAVKFHNQIFDEDGYRATLEACRYDWYFLQTPKFQEMLEYQGLDEKTCRWIYVLLGRLFYNVGELENWQVQPFWKGVAGSGKSTILNFLRDCFEKIDVGVLGNDSQRGFSIEGLIDKLLYMVYDCDQNFQLDQMLWQSMVVGEDCVINRKYKTALVLLWTSPGILVGNVTPNWQNNGDSVARRVILIDFGKVVKSDQSDPHLYKKLVTERPTFIKKCNMALHQYVNMYGEKDIWDVVCDYFKDQKKKLRSKTNVLSAFLESGEVVVKDGLYMRWEEFIEEYANYCKKYRKEIKELVYDYYSPTFQHIGIEVVRRALPEDCHDNHSEVVECEWIMCVCLKERCGNEGSGRPGEGVGETQFHVPSRGHKRSARTSRGGEEYSPSNQNRNRYSSKQPRQRFCDIEGEGECEGEFDGDYVSTQERAMFQH